MVPIRNTSNLSTKKLPKYINPFWIKLLIDLIHNFEESCEMKET